MSDELPEGWASVTLGVRASEQSAVAAVAQSDGDVAIGRVQERPSREGLPSRAKAVARRLRRIDRKVVTQSPASGGTHPRRMRRRESRSRSRSRRVLGLWEWETGIACRPCRSPARELVAAVGPDNATIGDERRERIAHRGRADLGEVADLAMGHGRRGVGEDALDAFER